MPAGRLRAIIVKLELQGTNDTAIVAVTELRKALVDYRKSNRNFGIGILIGIFILLAGVGGLVYWIFSK